MPLLYPKSRHYPFDEFCEQIVRELEKRHWQFPKINVGFYNYRIRSGDQDFRMVQYIRGEDFRLFFCRKQGVLRGCDYNDIAAVSCLVIPGKELRVYEDNSGPSFFLYVGDDWSRDRDEFIESSKDISKLKGKPKKYLQYTGGCNCTVPTIKIEDIDSNALSSMSHTHYGKLSPVMIHTNDSGREYDPEGEEPRILDTMQVMDEFRTYLKEVVLSSIISQPIPA